ncbi:J domain-containing protein [Sphingomonas jatrophae]|uniref:J domain-containing protein n=1 Tax=Sphingomonas jatrophae TaxID=1166337 RepID=A0A1I6LHP9_9SPHN|nr:molecular chaperone DnaJ [Sphingomonas jatrophae]SFS02926.1 hypothetical protein SAMN05192580_2746 [Sphingomonas jatrophae]
MGLTLIVAILVTGWAWKSGRLKALRYGDVAAAVAALVALNGFRHGSPGLGFLGFAVAGAWLFWRRKEPAVLPDTEEARRLLELPHNASAAEVRAAHRRLIARVHPDAGGSAELARRVNAARDVLLEELNSTAVRAS